RIAAVGVGGVHHQRDERLAAPHLRCEQLRPERRVPAEDGLDGARRPERRRVRARDPQGRRAVGRGRPAAAGGEGVRDAVVGALGIRRDDRPLDGVYLTHELPAAGRIRADRQRQPRERTEMSGTRDGTTSEAGGGARRPRYVSHDGFLMPMGFPVEGFESGLRYRPAPDDVFVASYPKCGTTWTQYLLYLLLHGGEPLASDGKLEHASPHLEE